MAEDAARPTETRPRLGRGLAALLGDVGDEAAAVERSRGQRKTPIEFLRPNLGAPAQEFRRGGSRRTRGVDQGAWRPFPACSRARLFRGSPTPMKSSPANAGGARRNGRGLHEILIVIIEAGDREALEIAIVENVQRADLNALEEANGYAQLGEEYSYSHNDIARIIGKSRSHIANTLRLLKLPDFARSLLTSGEISAGHARALLAFPDPDATARKILAEGLTVRDVERLGQQTAEGPTRTPAEKGGTEVDADTRALEHRLSVALGTAVTIRHRGESGELRIKFSTLEQLDEFSGRLCHSEPSVSGNRSARA